MSIKTPGELIRYMVWHTAAAPENAEIAEPGTEGHAEPWEPWSAPVMLLAGSAPNGLPWLFLACRCGWWLGYAPQYDPIELAKVAMAHAENCQLKAAPDPLTDVPMVCTSCRKPVEQGAETGLWFHSDTSDPDRCSRTVPVKAMVAAGNGDTR